MVRFGDITAQASVSELTAPTKLDTGKYTDTGKMVCKAVIEGLAPDTAYTYQISYDGGQTWSQEYTYTTPGADEFSFAFTSDPQIKEDQSHERISPMTIEDGIQRMGQTRPDGLP